MSRHVGRKQRWTRVNAWTHTSAEGRAVFERDGWYGLLSYRTLVPAEEGPAVWEAHERRFGPFRRERDAMVAVEREATALKNRHGAGVTFGGHQP